MSAKIFVNYRRDDAPDGAARVRDGLAAKFGKSSIFMDVDNLLMGQRFDVKLAQALDACDVLIAIIGPRWGELLKVKGANEERDYVREEIAAALKRKIVVIPVRVGREGAMSPLPRPDDLPDDIRDLVLYQKHDVTHERFGRDIAELVEGIVAVRKEMREGTRPTPMRSVVWRWAVAAIASACAIGYASAYYIGIPLPWPSSPSADVPTAHTAMRAKADSELKAKNDEVERLRNAAAKAEDDRKQAQAEATKLRADVEAKRKADEDVKAKAAAEAEAKKKMDEAERQRIAALKADEERRRAEAAAASEATRRAEEAAARTASISSSLPVVRSERKFRLASSFSKSMTTLFSSGVEFADELSNISSSKLTVQVFAAGELVSPLGVLDAAKSGAIDMGWTYAGYYFGLEPALSVVAGGLPLGKNATAFVTWLRGEGRAPRDELFASLGVKAFPCSMVGPRGLWVKKLLNNENDLKGLKLHFTGALGQTMRMHGVVVTPQPRGEIYRSLERNVIDGAEGLTPSMDEPLSFYRVAKYYYYPFAEPTFSFISDLIIGLSEWKTLESAARDAIELACSHQLTKDVARLQDGAAEAVTKMIGFGASIRRVPEPLAAALQQTAGRAATFSITSGPGIAVWRSFSAGP